MDTLVASVLEKSLVGGAFIYLLVYIVNNQNKTLVKISETLNKICDTMVELERRVSDLERKR